MNVLGKELGERFERVYNLVLVEPGKSIEFLPLSQLKDIPREDLRGARRRHPEKPDRIIIYLDAELSDQEFELTAAHELCHEVVRGKGIGIEYRAQGVSSESYKQAMRFGAELTNCLAHVAVSLCMKEHGFEISNYDNRSLLNVQSKVRNLVRMNKWSLIIDTIHCTSHVCRKRYGCPTLDVDRLINLYKGWHTRVVKFSHRFDTQISNIDILSKMGYYHATKELRGEIAKEFKIDLGWLLFRHPETGQAE